MTLSTSCPAPAAAFLGYTLIASLLGCTESQEPAKISEEPAKISEEMFVQSRCGVCHRMPSPDSFSVEQWPTVVHWMSDTIKNMNRVESDNSVIPRVEYDDSVIQRVINYYTTHSPTALAALPADPSRGELRFTPKTFSRPPQLGITHVNAVDLDGDENLDLLICESAGLGKKTGRLSWLSRPGGTQPWKEGVIADLPHPAHAEVLDVDHDGDLDIAVAVLGIFEPSEAPAGQVALLINDGNENFATRIILEDVGRVADARPADLNGDGRIDFSVAEFGHRMKGSVGWLEQLADGSFAYREILAIAGTIHVPVVDLNGDGALDIIALISQQREAVVAFLNDGEGHFRQKELFAARGPEFGASGMELIDLDRDGDIDILLVNGDTADTGAKTRTKLRPYNGVRWLENQGELTFVSHEIIGFYGAYSVAAGDLDGDGDVDIAAGSFLTDLLDPERFSLIWLENDGKQNFKGHGLAKIPRALVTLELADVDRNGRTDIVAGGLLMPAYAPIRNQFLIHDPLSLWVNW